MTALEKASSSCKQQTRPPVKKSDPHEQIRNSVTVTKNPVLVPRCGLTPRQTGRLTVGNIMLTLTLICIDDMYYWLWTQQMTEPSSRQKEHPTSTKPQMSDSNIDLVRGPRRGLIPRLTSQLTVRRNVTLFADDACIYAAERKGSYVLTKLQRGLNAIETWCERWNTKLRPSTFLIDLEPLSFILHSTNEDRSAQKGSSKGNPHYRGRCQATHTLRHSKLRRHRARCCDL
jgi:hypothetical protein